MLQTHKAKRIFKYIRYSNDAPAYFSMARGILLELMEHDMGNLWGERMPKRCLEKKVSYFMMNLLPTGLR